MNRRATLSPRNAINRLAGLLIVMVLLAGCADSEAPLRYEESTALHRSFSGQRAFEEVAVFVDYGPHPPGTEASLAYIAHLERTLSGAGWTTKRQSFQDPTPMGDVQFTNLRARFAISDRRGHVDWQKGGHILVASHFDTKYFADIEFVGANDGGSSSGILLELARCLAHNPGLAERVELVFFDGEEAYVDFTSTDGLYGSRHYAARLRKADRSSWPQAMVLLDLVGERELNIRIPPNGSAELLGKLYRAANDLGTRKYFGQARHPITDDHVPFNHLRIPAINVIDLDYAHWHKATDTLDKISPASLEIVGKTTLLFIEKYLLCGKAED